MKKTVLLHQEVGVDELSSNVEYLARALCVIAENNDDIDMTGELLVLTELLAWFTAELSTAVEDLTSAGARRGKGAGGGDGDQ